MEKTPLKLILFNKIRRDAMYPSVVKVSPGKDYVLSIVFDNGESGTLDMKQFLDFGVFKRLKNYDIFKTVRVSFDTIEWDTGIDLDPEFIYIECKKVAQQIA
jgi:hypothetical protein